MEVFLVGVGGVGGELIEQIKHQKDYLAKKDIEIRVCALANSNKMLLNENGLNLDNWQKDLENATQPSDFDVLLSFIKLHHVVNPVFVDCTSAESLASLYERALAEGFHVVTPNKKANTRALDYYHKLRELAHKNQGDAGRQVSAYLIDQQRVVRATENDRVDPLILCQQTIDMLPL